METYTPDQSTIVHHTGVDFTNRMKFFKPVHVVQYDDKLPVLAIALYDNSMEYTLPDNASMNIRLGKYKNQFVINPALGCSEDRKTAYFEVTQQMVTEWGKLYPIIELCIGDTVAGSSPITMIVDRNPVQEGDIESTTEYKTGQVYTEEAKNYADQAKKSEELAKQYAGTAETASQTSTGASEQAEASAEAAKGYSETAEVGAARSREL